MIKVFLTGRLGRDAEVRQAGGSAVAGFSVATDVGYGNRKQTLWFDCSIWGKRAESGLIDYLKKGQQVAISGELSEREHEGKVYKQIRVDDLDLMGGKSEPQRQPEQQAGGGGHGGGLEDDIPF
jgi:single-strand DNA-binding protein